LENDVGPDLNDGAAAVDAAVAFARVADYAYDATLCCLVVGK
jgi:hypothetical protein